MVMVTSEQDMSTLAPAKGLVSLPEAWAQLRRVEPLGWGALYLTVTCHPALTQTAVATNWGTTPLRVRRELNVGLGWLTLWTGLEPAEILERLRAGEVAA